MSNGKLLLFIIAILPILSWFTLRFFKHSQVFYNFCYRLFPILYLVNVFQGADYFAKGFNVFTISESIRGVSLALYADKISILFLFLIGFIWLLFAFYSKKFFEVISDKNADYFKEFFVLIVSFLNLLILSKNLFTILFFYICLIVSSHFFGIKYFHKVENKLTKSFTFLLYFESFLIFLATVATFKINGQIEFVDKIILPLNYDEFYHGIIFLLFFFGLFLAMMMPFYIFFKNINFDGLSLFVIFLMAYGFSSGFVFLKIINYIYGIKGFAVLAKVYGTKFFEILFLINIAITSFFIFKERDLKASSFFLFVHQFNFLIFSILIHLAGKFNYAFISFFAFIINFILIFFCLANFEIYFKKSNEKNYKGLFHLMPITSCILFFSIFSLTGLSPSISTVDKFFIIFYIIKNKLYFSLIIYFLNFITLLAFSIKIIKIFLNKEVDNSNSKKLSIAKKIDFDSNLILSILSIAIISFVGLIFFSYIIQFLSFYEPIKG
jgi:formate hydrogenlyase subunit 3/multisubunit Na+/H+ antiporter MnhD subunit